MNRIWIFLILLLTLRNGYAEKVPKETAHKIALNWFAKYAPEAKKNSTIQKLSEYKYHEETAFYIFTFNKGGFVLISANDLAEPVLGYGFESSIPDIISNPVVNNWLESYACNIEFISQMNLKSAKINLKWENLKKDIFLKSEIIGVEPLLTTAWGQDWPYNAMCPEDPNGSGGHTLVGCVGIAMAQIFKYYNYPEKGIGNYSYYLDGYGTISAKFDSVNYDWDEMTDVTVEFNTNIAKICADAAISVASEFGPNNTPVTWVQGTTLRNPVEPALISFFDYAYSELKFLKRSEFSDTTWTEMLINEINFKRPVYYRANQDNTSFGHAWIIDGYDSNGFFHCNWGWNGSFNGFFSLQSLNSGGYNFNTNHMAMFGIKPNDGSSINRSETWSGIKTLNHKIAVANNAVLNLEPGTTLKFAEDAHIEVWGCIKSNGLVNDSVYFTAIDTVKGWKGIKFEHGYNLPGFYLENDTSIFKNSVLEYSKRTACYINFYNKVKFDGCHIRNNSNLDFNLQWAGGINIIESDISIKNSVFSNNLSDFGGGLSILLTVTNNKLIIENNKFINNHANYCGGGLKLQADNTNGIISNNFFMNNYAGRGGGAYLYASNSKLINNIFRNNHGAWTGGGIYIDGNNYGEIELYQNQIYSNTGGMGAGVFIWFSNPKFINNNFSKLLIRFYTSNFQRQQL